MYRKRYAPEVIEPNLNSSKIRRFCTRTLDYSRHFRIILPELL